MTKIIIVTSMATCGCIWAAGVTEKTETTHMPEPNTDANILIITAVGLKYAQTNECVHLGGVAIGVSMDDSDTASSLRC